MVVNVGVNALAGGTGTGDVWIQEATAANRSIIVVQDWTQELARLVPAKR